MAYLESNFNGIGHVGIPVTNLERSKAFYERLGFEDVMSDTFIYEGGTGHVSMLKRGEVIMELYQMPETQLVEIRARMDGRIDHVAFDVSDIDQAYAELKEAGFEMLEEAPVKLDFWVKGCKYFNISGPDGERLEFCQIL